MSLSRRFAGKEGGLRGRCTVPHPLAVVSLSAGQRCLQNSPSVSKSPATASHQGPARLLPNQ